MRYQVLKQLKTKNKLIGLFDSLKEAHNYVRGLGTTFNNFSYIGGFPIYFNYDGTQAYSIQGLADIGVVCSLPEKEKSNFMFADNLPL